METEVNNKINTTNDIEILAPVADGNNQDIY